MKRLPNADCRMPIVRKTLCLCASVALCLVFSGCCSTYMVSQHNNRVENSRLLRIQASNNGVALGVDLINLDVKGYFAAWKEDPWGMAAATVGDAAIAFGGYKLYEAAKDDSSSSSSATTPTIQSNGGDVYVIQGNGNSIERTRSQEAQ